MMDDGLQDDVLVDVEVKTQEQAEVTREGFSEHALAA